MLVLLVSCTPEVTVGQVRRSCCAVASPLHTAAGPRWPCWVVSDRASRSAHLLELFGVLPSASRERKATCITLVVSFGVRLSLLSPHQVNVRCTLRLAKP